MTLVTIFLTAGSALRGTVERESSKLKEYGSLAWVARKLRNSKVNKLSRLPSNRSCAWLFFLCCAIRGCPKRDELSESVFARNSPIIGLLLFASSAQFLCTLLFGSVDHIRAIILQFL